MCLGFLSLCSKERLTYNFHFLLSLPQILVSCLPFRMSWGSIPSFYSLRKSLFYNSYVISFLNVWKHSLMRLDLDFFLYGKAFNYVFYSSIRYMTIYTFISSCVSISMKSKVSKFLGLKLFLISCFYYFNVCRVFIISFYFLLV